MTNEQTVQQFYIAYYGRPAEPNGLTYWVGRLEAGVPLSTLIAWFGNPANPEFNAIYGAAVTPTAFIQEVYENILNRPAEANGLAFWEGSYQKLIDQGLTDSQARAEIVVRIINGIQGEQDTLTWANQQTIAEQTTELASQLTDPAEIPALINYVRDVVLTNPNLFQQSVYEAEVANIDSLFDLLQSDTPMTYTLTPDVDDIVGNLGDDVFNAPAIQTPGTSLQTLNTDDFIDGLGGRNTLNAQLAGIISGVTPAGIINIQEVNLSGDPSVAVPLQAVGLSLINSNAVDTIGIREPTANFQIFDLPTKLETVNLSNDGLGGLHTIQHVGPALDGPNDAVSINLNDVGSTTLFGLPTFTSLGLYSGPILPFAPFGPGPGPFVQSAGAGYETWNVNSTGLDINVFNQAVADPSTINVAGDQALIFTGSNADLGLNVAVLDTFDASSLNANLQAWFSGPGSITAMGGQQDDILVFGGGESGPNALFNFAGNPSLNVAATAMGNAGNDIFFFQQVNNLFNALQPGEFAGEPSFDTNDSVDGGTGINTLAIQASAGPAIDPPPGTTDLSFDLLVDGVGPNITNIDIIRHVTSTPFDLTTFLGLGDSVPLAQPMTVNMARSGSATVLELYGDYANQNVTVTNLLNTDVVRYGDPEDNGDINDLTLRHVQTANPLDTVTLQLRDSADIDGALITAINPLAPFDQIETVFIDVGPSSTNPNFGFGEPESEISDASQIDSDISLSGPGDLDIGDNVAYDFANGIIDAQTNGYSGDLQVWLGTENQLVYDGLGDDEVVIEQASADVNAIAGAVFDANDLVDLGTGGNDVVEFEERTLDATTGQLNGDDYHQIVNFTVDPLDGADEDAIQLDLAGAAQPIALLETASVPLVLPASPVTAGDPLVIFNYTSGNADATATDAQYNYIKVVPAQVLPTPATSPDQAWKQVVGLDSITVDTDGAVDLEDYLVTLYDDTNDQMVMLAVHENGTGNVLDNTSDVDVIGLVSMSYADYQAFDGSNLSFVA